MIKEIKEYLERIGADQITFRRVGYKIGSHLNIMVEDMNDFNQSGSVMVTNAFMEGVAPEDNLDDMVLRILQNNYNYAMNDKSPFFEECCPNCGAVAGEYEVTTMGGTPDKNKRTCLRCQCTWYGYEVTASLVTKYIKMDKPISEKKDGR